MGKRMSAAMIAQIYAVAETPGMPPCDFDPALADEGKAVVPAPADFVTTGLSEIDPTQTDLPQAEVIDDDAAQESPTPEDEAGIPEDEVAPGLDPDLRLYRKRTVGLLRRYMRLSIEVGRLPSLLGREFFRTRVTSYRASTFEDSVILVHDVEVCLGFLDVVDRTLIGMIVMQDHSQEETAMLLQCTRRTIVRRYGEALDRMSAIFLKRNVLARLPVQKSISEKACQEGESSEFPVSC